jgi:SulP family sulfate permease
MTDKTTIEICKNLEEDAPESDSNLLLRKDIPNDTVVFEIRGPFFYSVADLLDEALAKLDKTPRVFVLSLSKTPLIDATGLNSIKKFNIKCGQRNIIFCIADFPASKKEMLLKAGLTEKQLFKTIYKALKECDDSTF